jgi:hypothetical protein
MRMKMVLEARVMRTQAERLSLGRMKMVRLNGRRGGT